jgi:3-hydroxyisobutyrate dehydrogenase-like beta-hydroxyacid dehydrogenase
VAPETKRSAARIVERAGGHYVDIAIMAPVAPASSSVPLLLAGPEAERANAALTRLGFSNLRTAGLTVGAASGIKMCRSIMVKGIEALTAEMMAAANLEGVSELVLASLEASERQLDWTHRASYNLHRIAEHGQRRAAEMDQVVEYLTAIGVDPVMSRATAQRQRTGSVAGSQQGRTA